MTMLDGKVAIVTGAANGVGRAEALELAAQGASVVVNDLGVSVDARQEDGSAPVDEVVDTIRARGGTAVADYTDVGDWAGVGEIFARADREFGKVDILVNNAGILRRGSVAETSEDDFDALTHVHFKGTFAMLHHAGRYWAEARAQGRRERAAVINTISNAFLVGGVETLGAYGANKAAVAALTLSCALEWKDLGVSVNAIAPVGLTRMNAFSRDLADQTEPEFSSYDPRDPANNAPLVAWLASDEAAYLSGQVFEVFGGLIRHWRPWTTATTIEQEGRWNASDLGSAMATDVFRVRSTGLPDPSTLGWNAQKGHEEQ